MAETTPPFETGPRWNAANPVGASDTVRAVSLLAARLPPALASFAALAYDLACFGKPEGARLFEALDPQGWEASGHNPVRLLLQTPAARLVRVAEDRQLLARAASLRRLLEDERRRPFAEVGAIGAERPVAYLCAEFGVHPSLPFYAGGLGVLAGDFLKEASDRGVPLVGIGLYYQQGYFHQQFDPSNWQHEYWIDADPHTLPLSLVTDPWGIGRTVSVPIRGRNVAFRIWRAAIGRSSLYLLDANHPENQLVDRWITARLYDSERHTRLAQYAALGIGGIRALRTLGIEPAVVHLNEGHAAFAILELAREGIAAGRSPEDAVAEARHRLVFTTHTPVAAGNESFTTAELWPVLGDLVAELGIDREWVLRLGRVRPDDPAEPLGLTVLALRSSSRATGVSRRHGEVSREMWKSLWPERRSDDVPIGFVTNGVHLPTWMAPAMRALLDRHLGEGWHERADDPDTWNAVDAIPDAELWRVRNALRAELVEFVRRRSVWDRLRRGDPPSFVEAAAHHFDADVLTAGFARRIAKYKRLHIFARYPDRSMALLRGPIQFVTGGKAHPRDEEAKRALQRLENLRQDQRVMERAEFMTDYDLSIGARLVAGCDVWVNLPLPPMEACGTSGMKAMLNGGLNLSVLDGWWAEAFDGSNGWAIPAEPDLEEGARNDRDAALYFDLLEREVIPLFYDRDASGIPRGWIRRIKASLRSNGPRFCTARMLGDYVRRVYATR